MQYKFSDFIERNIEVPEVNSALKSIERQIENIRNHLYSLPFESEPSEFLKVLSDWQSQKKHSEDNNGG
tara:strand:- start:116 stop:322 length:207 start_codon:yes stop_codon:yes gene_type:complete